MSGKKAMWWWQGGGSAGSKGGDVTNVWSSCPVHRLPDPLPPAQQQPQQVHNGGGRDHGEALHSSQTDPGVGMHLPAFGQDETPLGAAAGGPCHHHCEKTYDSGPKYTVVVLWEGELGLNGSHELAGSTASWVKPCTVA